MKKNHFIIVGRTSAAIAENILHTYGTPAPSHNGPIINQAGNVFQAQMGTFAGGESVFKLFVDGKLEDHPIQQNLTKEAKAELAAQLKGAHVTLVHSISGDNTTSRAMSLLHGARDLKRRYGVASITLETPHLPYLRNDRQFEDEYNAVSCAEYAEDLKSHGIDRVVAFEPHSRDSVKIYEAVFGKNVEFCNMGSFFAEDIAKKKSIINADGTWNIAVGSPDGWNKPDDYGVARAKSFGIKLYDGTEYEGFRQSDRIEKIPFMFGIHKKRLSPTETKIVGFHGNVEGRDAIIIDDIISTGGTTENAAEELKKHGARTVMAIATHAVLTKNGLPRILESPFIDEVYLTDTIPGAYEKAGKAGFLTHPKLHIKTVASIILDEIAKDHKRGSAKWRFEAGTMSIPPETTPYYAPTPQVG